MKRQPFFAKSHCFLRACAHGAFCTALRPRRGTHMDRQKEPNRDGVPRKKKTAPKRDGPFLHQMRDLAIDRVAEGHSMSILLFGFLGWSLGRVTDKMPLSYFALIASLSTSPT